MLLYTEAHKGYVTQLLSIYVSKFATIANSKTPVSKRLKTFDIVANGKIKNGTILVHLILNITGLEFGNLEF